MTKEAKEAIGSLKILAIIPARSGSKSIPDKNIQSVNGKPLIAYSIEHGLQSRYINRVLVSTDSDYYAQIAVSFGAEVPFLRPAAISLDHSTDIEVFMHALAWLKEQEGYEPDIVVHLRPTCPVRNAADIDAMIDLLVAHPEADAVRSMVRNDEPVYKMWFQNEDGFITPVVTHPDFPEAYNMPRQMLPPSFLQNASVDIARGRTIIEKKSMTGDKILGYVMETNYDIDYRHQLGALPAGDLVDKEKQTFVFDIDGVVAYLSPNNDYALAKPNQEIITKVNELYDAGHIIVLFTARGSKTGIDWRATTENQMNGWGVKYHELRLGKPFADYYVDDRMLSINDVLNLKTRNNGKL